MKLVRSALFAAILGPVSGALAQPALEVITLRYSTAEQVLPTLRPLLEPGATLTGKSSQLIVRASPGNIAEIRRALEAIDLPRKRLQISVRFDESQASAEGGVAAAGRIGRQRSHVEARGQSSGAVSAERVDQRIQVLEGGRAYIATGQVRTQPARQIIQTPAGVVAQDTFIVHETSSGFEVSPRLSGDRVLLEVYAQRERPGALAQDGVQAQRLSSTASASLGEWFELGSAEERASRDARGLASGSRSRLEASRSVWIKVEALPE